MNVVAVAVAVAAAVAGAVKPVELVVVPVGRSADVCKRLVSA